jgi:hypothetical protein
MAVPATQETARLITRRRLLRTKTVYRNANAHILRLMSRTLSLIVILAWALWLGGLVTLFATLGTIFTTPGFEREVQGAFAARLFPMFERMQLIFAAVALLFTAAWWIAFRSRVKLLVFGLFAIATLIAVFETTRVTPTVARLIATGQRGTPEFERMHNLSTRVYAGGAVVLLVAGFVLPAAIRSDVTANHSLQTSEETAPA